MRPLRLSLALGVLAALSTACGGADAEVAPAPRELAEPVESPEAAELPAVAESHEVDEPAGVEETAELPAPKRTDAPAANAGALAFTGRRLGGGSINGQDHAGGPVVLWMWAPWCPQCNREAPHVAEALRTFAGRVTLIGVPGHDSDEAHLRFVEEHGLTGMLHAVDDDGSLWAMYGVAYQPAWVFIGADGDVEVVAGGLFGELAGRMREFLDG